jgi:hypothetical protein
LYATESAAKGAVESGTNSKQTLAWTRFQQYIKHIKILDDPFLNKFDRYQRIKIISAFAQQSEKADSIIEEILLSSPNHVKPPLTAWHRPSAWQIDQTQDLTKMENLLYFYTDNSEDTKNPTNPRNKK